jgi:glycosyltransferase involved in cell wall biosynthesis
LKRSRQAGHPGERSRRARGPDGGRTTLGIVYPSDPLGSIPGGIETFIRGIIRWAPADIEVCVVGATTDATARPVGTWNECTVEPGPFRHFPVYEVSDPRRQSRIPATIRFMGGLLRYSRQLRGTFDVLEFHRVEPVALFIGDRTPKTAVLHTDMDAIRDPASDIRWRHLPAAYFHVERALLRHLGSVFVVSESVVSAYKQRYPDLAGRFRFTATWMDPEIFQPSSAEVRSAARARLLGSRGVPDADRVLISVGRIDRGKDPLLLTAAFAKLCEERKDLWLVFVGDGALRAETEARVATLGLQDRVLFTGLLPPRSVAEYLNAADLFVLSSAYEGMPMSVLEALGCGLPACSTDVGEVRRIVHPGRNGEIVNERTAGALARGIADCLERLHIYRGLPATEAARPFVPEKVLAPLYENYRRLAKGDGAGADRAQ